MNALTLLHRITAALDINVELTSEDEARLTDLKVKIGTGNFNPNAWEPQEVTLESEAFRNFYADNPSEYDEFEDGERSQSDTLWITAPGQCYDSPYAPTAVMEA